MGQRCLDENSYLWLPSLRQGVDDWQTMLGSLADFDAFVAAANAGCLLQIAQHARQTGRALRVVHPIDLLAEAYGEDGCLAAPCSAS